MNELPTYTSTVDAVVYSSEGVDRMCDSVSDGILTCHINDNTFGTEPRNLGQSLAICSHSFGSLWI